MAELVDAHGSGPCAARCGGSSPSVGTKQKRSVAQATGLSRLAATSKAPARFAGGTRKPGPAGPGGVAERDRVPPWAPKQKRSVAQATGLLRLAATSNAPARFAGGTRKPGPAGPGGVAVRDRASSVGTKALIDAVNQGSDQTSLIRLWIMKILDPAQAKPHALQIHASASKSVKKSLRTKKYISSHKFPVTLPSPV